MINKVIEIQAQSNVSWEDAAKKAVDDVSKTVKNIRSIYIQDMSAKVDNNKITEYRIDGKVTFGVNQS